MNVAKRGIIYGMAIGDGYVQVRERLNKGKYPYTARSMRVKHGVNQKLYCEWKAERLGHALGGRQIKVYPTKGKIGNKIYQQFHFTVSHPYFGQVHRILYPNGEKYYSAKMLDKLTPEGIAIWYMDDGHARKNVTIDGFVKSVATEIATMCSEEEVNTIIQWFDANHGIKFKKRFMNNRSQGKGYYIQVNTEESRKFIKLIEKFIPECMKYKLSHVASMHQHERQTPAGFCDICGQVYYAERRKGLCVKCYTREYRKAKLAG